MKVFIVDPIKAKCLGCGSTISMSNDSTIMFRNFSFVSFDKDKKQYSVKCKCKYESTISEDGKNVI